MIKKLVFMLILLVFSVVCYAEYIGDFPEDVNVVKIWQATSITGGSVMPDSNGTITILRIIDGITITAGITNSAIDTGFYKCVVDTSSDSNYATGYDYEIWTHDANVDGELINAEIAQFSIHNRFDNGKTGYSLSGAQTFNLTGNVTGNLSGSVGSVTGDVNVTQAGADKTWGTTVRTITGGTITTYTGNTPQSGDSYAIDSNGTYGNSAIKTKLNLVGVDANDGAAKVDTYLNATISSRLSKSDADANYVEIINQILATQSKIDLLPVIAGSGSRY